MLPYCMHTLINKNINLLSTIFKYGISIISLSFISYKIIATEFTFIDISKILTIKTITIVLILAVGNWVFEILKWQTVINTFSNISFKKASFQTLVSYTYGMITPFNSGNYLKKIFFFPKEHSKKVVFLNVIKGIYQMITTMLFGLWGVYILLDKIDFKLLNQQKYIIGIGVLFIISILFLKQKISHYFKNLSLTIHLKLLVFSIIKFLFFSSILMILLKNKETHPILLYAGICTVYMLSSLLPILNILDFAIKGSVALIILKPLGLNEATILICYFVLWILNHALPATLGSIIQLHKTKTSKYD